MIIAQSTNTAELAVVERTVVVEQGYENRWLFSTKRLRARGTYAAKGGFDLTKGVDVSIDEKDAAGAVNGMVDLARSRAEEEGVLTSARDSVTDQPAARLAESTDLKVEIDFREPGMG